MSDEWRTPKELFESLNESYHFELDIAATEQNALCPQYFTKEQNALTKIWAPKVCWMNPPYSLKAAFVAKAWSESLRGATVVGLLPVNTEQVYWHEYILYPPGRPPEIQFIRKRVRFLQLDGTPLGSPRFASAIVIWRPQ